ncbi:MAG: histidine kinase, partial [Bacteroidota bacterium]|nr:histidine kinase [Bacteroidota bacterium]
VMEGYNNKWQSTQNTSLNYTFFEPGTYTFRVRSEDYKKQQSFKEDILTFQVLPFWYETILFKIAMALLVIAAVWLIAFIILRYKRKQELLKMEVEAKFAELKLFALKSQMNPHFVSNALSSIQYLIQNNINSLAESYLVRFSKLMRLFLESSKSEFISLENELNLINNYLEIEMLRFSDRIKYHIQLHPQNLDTAAIYLPSLLIQPFVENSLNHGLFHKEGKGHIKIDIYDSKNELKIIIEDDGIGRIRAKELQSKNLGHFKSRGMEIVKDRIDILEQQKQSTIKIDIEDLYENAEASGTRVTLSIKELK